MTVVHGFLQFAWNMCNWISFITNIKNTIIRLSIIPILQSNIWATKVIIKYFLFGHTVVNQLDSQQIPDTCAFAMTGYGNNSIIKIEYSKFGQICF